MLMMVDVDSTLYDADPVFAQTAKQEGIPWLSRAPFYFKPEDIGVDRVALTNMFRKAHSREMVMKQVPYTGAVIALQGLAEDGWSIWYVSSRHPQAQSAMEDWLREQGFPDYQNAVAIKDKRPWLDGYRPEVVVDDRVQTMIYSRYEIEAEVFSIRHLHNTNLVNEVPGIHIMDTWDEIGQGVRNYARELIA